ncbi:MAG: C25 family cysteine peptidase, partial [Myxococcaceae bacterium]
FFQDPRRESLAVATLLAPSGGAWGAWGSTSMTYPTEHSALDRALARAILIEGKTLGEATREALAETTDVDLANTFVLLGDPSARAVAVQSSALTSTSAPRPGAFGCSSTGAPIAFLAPLVLASLALSARRGRALWQPSTRRSLT